MYEEKKGYCFMETFRGLLSNAVFLLALVLIYGESNLALKSKQKLKLILIGFVIGVFGVLIMMNSWRFGDSTDPNNTIFYDTRSVLISVTGVFFGAIPTIVASVITVAYRI